MSTHEEVWEKGQGVRVRIEFYIRYPDLLEPQQQLAYAQHPAEQVMKYADSIVKREEKSFKKYGPKKST